MPAGVLGEIVKFRLEVTNLGGYYNTSYEHLAVVVADVPSKPPTPVIDYQFTDPTRIKVDLTEPITGGSVLLNFEVLMDDGLGEGYQIIFGGNTGTFLETEVIVSQHEEDKGFTHDVQRGLFYRFKFRAQNVNGWGPYSDAVSVQAARRPDAP